MQFLQDKLLTQTTIAGLQQHPLHPAMWHKRPRLMRNNLPFVLHDNARCHVAKNVTFLLRWRLKEPFRGHQFPDASSVGFFIADINNDLPQLADI
ncbi:hypothetical protein TNCV_2280391 [Trichonephila clavipes]|nr:hypothetical protein TNCV_2280391 [Trichonephila clavipes]